MERLMKAQTMQNNEMSPHMRNRRVMEINPTNPIIIALRKSIEKSEKSEEAHADKLIKDLIWLLYENTLIHSGFSLNDPAKFSCRINQLIHLGLGLDDDGSAGDDAVAATEDAESTLADICDDDDDSDTMEMVD
jgi:molecular chaperone HtpG